jgi:hypothetical protein
LLLLSLEREFAPDFFLLCENRRLLEEVVEGGGDAGEFLERGLLLSREGDGGTISSESASSALSG